MRLYLRSLKITVGRGQYHLAVAGGCAAVRRLHLMPKSSAPTRYREVVLTPSKFDY